MYGHDLKFWLPYFIFKILMKLVDDADILVLFAISRNKEFSMYSNCYVTRVLLKWSHRSMVLKSIGAGTNTLSVSICLRCLFLILKFNFNNSFNARTDNEISNFLCFSLITSFLWRQKLFEPLKTTQPDFERKLVMCEGDLLMPNLGLSKEDRQAIVNNVSIVFHSAATVRFDEPLK